MKTRQPGAKTSQSKGSKENYEEIRSQKESGEEVESEESGEEIRSQKESGEEIHSERKR